jgi:hypothetical protein
MVPAASKIATSTLHGYAGYVNPSINEQGQAEFTASPSQSLGFSTHMNTWTFILSLQSF